MTMRFSDFKGKILLEFFSIKNKKQKRKQNFATFILKNSGNPLLAYSAEIINNKGKSPMLLKDASSSSVNESVFVVAAS